MEEAAQQKRKEEALRASRCESSLPPKSRTALLREMLKSPSEEDGAATFLVTDVSWRQGGKS